MKWQDGNGQIHDMQCGWCNRQVGSYVRSVGIEQDAGGSFPAGYLTVCSVCGAGSTLLRGRRRDTFVQFPEPLSGADLEHLPDDVERAYTSARRALQAGSLDGASMVLRNLISHVAVDLGAKKGQSYKQYVTWLSDEAHIPPGFDDAVDRLRDLGNETAHELVQADHADILLALDIAELLLRFKYETPGKIATRNAEAISSADA